MSVKPRLITASQVDRERLGAFLSRFFSPAKTSFLMQHGDWWHHGSQNRWIITTDEKIFAYCAVIPSQCWIGGEKLPAIWWVDLVVAPEFRGGGLQTQFDREIQRIAEFKLGFPNALAAAIHRKHGWGVREDLQVHLLPLVPKHIRSVREAQGWRKPALRFLAMLLAPVASLSRSSAIRYQPRSARRMEEPSPESLSNIFERHHLPDRFNTTYRDKAYLQWRYFDSPFASQYQFFVCGPENAPSHYLAMRIWQTRGVIMARVLDLFGDFADQSSLLDLLRTGIQHAAKQGAAQITIMNSLVELGQVLRSAGFIIATRARFCWISREPRLMKQLGEKGYWTLSDSDNDDPY